MQRLQQTAVHSICVAAAVTHPSDQAMDFLHMFSLLKRIMLLIVGIVMFATAGTRCSPGIGFPQFSKSEWQSVTYSDWRYDLLVGGWTISMPGSNLWPGLWILTVTVLIIYDTLRCVLVLSHRWNRQNNTIDMTWHMMAYIPLPLVFIGTSLTLGHRDILIMMSILLLVVFSSVCGAVLEQIRSLVNPGTIPGMPISVIFVLRGMQDVSMVIASQLVAVPLVANLFSADVFSPDDQPTSLQLLTFTLHCCLVLCLALINNRQSRLCTIFEQRWPENMSFTSWNVDRRTKNVDHEHKQSNHKDDDIPHPQKYEHSPYEPNTDVVRIVDGDKRVTTIKLTEDFHKKGVYDFRNKGMYVTRVRSHPSQPGEEWECVNSHKDHEDIAHMRRTTGMLMEWRRHYLINMLINSLLLVDIISITGGGPEGTCSLEGW
jgi:hypothetical protein